MFAYGSWVHVCFSGEMQSSVFLAFYTLFSVIEPSKALSASYFNVQKGMAALGRINEIMDLDIKIHDKADAVSKKVLIQRFNLTMSVFIMLVRNCPSWTRFN